MPVYNSELYIREAVDSILNQTFTDFEFIIIDDASTDQSVEIIQSYSDPRIQLIVKPKNTGYTNSLNYGLTIAKGEYIARMDSDDISLPERFEKQIAFLDTHPDVVLCGTQFQFIGSNRISKQPISYEELKVRLISASCIAHPTICFRAKFFKDFGISYDHNQEPAEDYDLWTRLIFISKIVNLKEVLLAYRVHTSQVSSARFLEQRKVSNAIKYRMLQKVSENINSESILFKDDLTATIEGIKSAYDELINLQRNNDVLRVYDTTFFASYIEEEKYTICKLVKNKNNLSIGKLLWLMSTRPKIYYYMIRYFVKKRFKL